jgi:hypothetical protein
MSGLSQGRSQDEMASCSTIYMITRPLLAYVEMYLYQDHFSESLSHAETRSLRSPLQDWPLK